MTTTVPFKPPADAPDAKRRAICCEALALARRAQAAGLGRTAELLDMAALEAAATFAFSPARRKPTAAAPRQIAPIDPMPHEPEALIAWASRHLFGDEQT